MRGTRRYLAPQNQEAVLKQVSAALLAAEGMFVPDWEIVGPQIAGEISRQSTQLLADARADYDGFERLRAQAAHAYRRADPVVCVLAGVIAGYLFLVSTGPDFFSLAVDNPGLGLTPLILSVFLVALGIRWVLWRRRHTRLMRSVPVAYERWTGVLENQVLRPFIVERRNDEERNPQLFHTTIGGKSPVRLIEGSEPLRLVVTEAMTRVRATARNVHSGSVGVSGPRGAGKSTILQFFGMTAADEGRDLRLVVSAPVDYEPREFIIHLFSQLCGAVPHGPADRSEIATETRRHLEQLRYLRTYSTNWSASLTPRTFLTLAGSYAKQRAEQPVTLPELVDSFRGYAGRVAAWQQMSVHHGEGRVVIGIDEVDKIRDSDRAEAFLNDIKAVFGIPGSLYLVSLSEDAITAFARRTASIRSTFDSAFDELVAVGPMTYQNSEAMLFKRVTGAPRPFIALCHVLAGGLPRDLLRAARALIDVTPDNCEKALPATAGDLIRRELESLRQASVRQLGENAAPGSLLEALHDRQWPGATPREFTDTARRIAGTARDAESDVTRQLCQELVVSLSFYATALETFSPAALDRLVICLKDHRYDVIDDLAAARYAMRVNVDLAHRLLEKYRVRNGIGRDHGIK